MPLPKNITKEDILQAIAEIDRNGYDPIYESHNYVLEFNGKLYPPKHVVRLANGFANGSRCDPLTFYPHEANRLLRHFKLTIREKTQPKEKKPNFKEQIEKMRDEIVRMLRTVDGTTYA